MLELTVIVEQCLAPVPGGTGRYAREITTAMAAAPPAGWTVRTVTAWHRDTTAAAISGTDGPHRLPAGHRVLSELWRRGLPPSVRGAAVHATTPLAPRRRHGLVVTVHDAVPWTHPETLTPRGVTWHRVMVGRAAATAEAIVVPSLAVADDLAGLFPAAADRIHVVGHGVTPLPPRRMPPTVAGGSACPMATCWSSRRWNPARASTCWCASMATAAVGWLRWSSWDHPAGAVSTSPRWQRAPVCRRIACT